MHRHNNKILSSDETKRKLNWFDTFMEHVFTSTVHILNSNKQYSSSNEERTRCQNYFKKYSYTCNSNSKSTPEIGKTTSSIDKEAIITTENKDSTGI